MNNQKEDIKRTADSIVQFPPLTVRCFTYISII